MFLSSQRLALEISELYALLYVNKFLYGKYCFLGITLVGQLCMEMQK